MRHSALLFGFMVLMGTALDANSQDTVRIREDIEVVVQDAAKMSALKLAFQTLRDSSDPSTNLRHWANIHGAVPPEVSTGPCTHQEEGIWAWHRSYLWQFENALRSSHPPETSQVTLPYWPPWENLWVVFVSKRRFSSRNAGVSAVGSNRLSRGQKTRAD